MSARRDPQFDLYIEQVLQATNIAEVIGETIELSPKGNDLVGAHHTHSSDSGKSFTVTPAKNVYYCFSCNEGGNVFHWMMRTHGMTFVEALDHLAHRAGISRPDVSPEQFEASRKRMEERQTIESIFEIATSYYQSELDNHPDIKQYLLDRGMTEDTLSRARIGFAPVDDDPLKDHLINHFTADELMASGLFVKPANSKFSAAFFQGRIVIPYLHYGRVVYMIGRHTEYTPDEPWESGKYKKLLTHSDKHPYVSKLVDNRYLYGVDSVRPNEPVIITEGIMDAIMAHQAGFACVSPVTVRFAKKDHDAILDAVKRASGVYIFNDIEDNDAGAKGAIDTAEFLESKDVECRIGELPKPDGSTKIDLADYLAGDHDLPALIDAAKRLHHVQLDRLPVPALDSERLPVARDFVVDVLTKQSDEFIVEGFIRDALAPKFDLTKADATALFRVWKNERANTEAAERRSKFEAVDGGPATSADPDDDPRFVAAPGQPYENANRFIKHFCTHDDTPILKYHRGRFSLWDGSAYKLLEDDALRKKLYLWLHESAYFKPDTGEIVEFKPDRRKVSDIIDGLRAGTHLPEEIEEPSWLQDNSKYSGLDPAKDIVAVKNGILDLKRRRLLPPTPQLFNHNALDFEFDPSAPIPAAWIRFLNDLWPDDPEAISTLQEIFGYLLTADTSQQKIFLLVGPRRSGKGTIGRILRELVGPANAAAPTLGGLATNFGMQPLIGKTLAVVSDARLSGRADDQIIVERLLTISGEDPVTIDRKNQSAWTGQLHTRFVLLTNELPRLGDASGALAGRFITLVFERSFYGQEDPTLTDRLLAELPGILRWAVDGWHRLNERGRFVLPQSSLEITEEMEEIASPVAAFVRAYCEVGDDCQMSVDELYDGWKYWCEEDGRTRPSTKQRFGRDLRSVLPGLATIYPTDSSTGRQIRAYKGVQLKLEIRNLIDEKNYDETIRFAK